MSEEHAAYLVNHTERSVINRLRGENEKLFSILADQLCNCGIIAPHRNFNPELHSEWCRYRRAVERNEKGAH